MIWREPLCGGSIFYHALPANWPEAHHSCTLLKCWPIPDYGAPAYTMISTSCNRQIAVRVFLTRKAVSLAALLLYQHSFIILDTDCSAYKRITQTIINFMIDHHTVMHTTNAILVQCSTNWATKPFNFTTNQWYNSYLSLLFKYMIFHISFPFPHLLWVYYKLKLRPAPRWHDSSVGRALHRYHRGHGFETRSGLNFFQALI